jgi:hypothetical protein
MTGRRVAGSSALLTRSDDRRPEPRLNIWCGSRFRDSRSVRFLSAEICPRPSSFSSRPPRQRRSAVQGRPQGAEVLAAASSARADAERAARPLWRRLRECCGGRAGGRPVYRLLPGDSRVTRRKGTGSGFQPAMVRAHSRATSVSVIPGNSRRNSTAAENSPSRSNTVRIASASASVTTNIPGAWGRTPWPAMRRSISAARSGYAQPRGRRCAW